MKNKTLRRLFSGLLCVLLTVSLIPMGALGAFAVVFEGTVGENITWVFDDETGKLTFSGTGTILSSQHYKPNDPEYYKEKRWQKITEIEIGEGITEIGLAAFSNCPVQRVTIPSTVRVIGERAFEHCTNLESVSFAPDSSLEEIRYSAFSGCESLSTLCLPASVKKLGRSILSYTAYASNEANKVDGMLICGHCVMGFTGDNLPDSLTIDNAWTVLFEDFPWLCHGVSAFHAAADHPTLSTADGVLFNKDQSVLIRYPQKKSGTEYTIPDSVREIGRYAFSGCAELEYIRIPDSVKSIRYEAFSDCVRLREALLPQGAEIELSVFRGCSGMDPNTGRRYTYMERLKFYEAYAAEMAFSSLGATVSASLLSPFMMVFPPLGLTALGITPITILRSLAGFFCMVFAPIIVVFDPTNHWPGW